MNTLVDQPLAAKHSNGRVYIQMKSGIELSFPIAANPRLAPGTDAQLDNIELSPFGLHWPELDEDLSMRGILAGDFGQRPHRAA